MVKLVMPVGTTKLCAAPVYVKVTVPVHGAPHVPGHCPQESHVMELHPLGHVSPGVHEGAVAQLHAPQVQPVLQVCVPKELQATTVLGAQTPSFWQGPVCQVPVPTQVIMA